MQQTNMNSVETAQVANRAADMLQNDNTFSKVTEYVRAQVLQEYDTMDTEGWESEVDQRVRHILRNTFDKLKRDYSD